MTPNRHPPPTQAQALTRNIAGIGCRRRCPAAEIIGLIHQAAALARCELHALATPAFKHDEPGIQQAAAHLNLPLLLVTEQALTQAQPHCPTHSDAALRATGHSSIAEAAALAAAGGHLRLPRIASPNATCAIATTP